MPAQTIALLNFKGGVGKTASTVNIAAALALHPDFGGQRVLVIDLDPQCNATFWMLTRPGWNVLMESGVTIANFFKPTVIAQDKKLKDYIVQVPNVSPLGKLDMVAGNFTLLAVDDDGIQGMTQRQEDEILWQALRPVLDDYDYIILDCPPGYSLPTRNALRAAKYVIVPYTPDYLALEGVKWIRKLQSRFAERHGWKNTASLLGVLVGRFTNFKAQKQAISELQSTLDDVQNYLDQQAYAGSLNLYTPFIKEGTRMNEANNEHLLLVDAYPDDPMTKSIVDLTKAIQKSIAVANVQQRALD